MKAVVTFLAILVTSMSLPAFAAHPPPEPTQVTCAQALSSASLLLLESATAAREELTVRKKLLDSLEERAARFEAGIQKDRANEDYLTMTKRILFGFSERAKQKQIRLAFDEALERRRQRVAKERQDVLMAIDALFKQYPQSRQALVGELYALHNQSLRDMQNYVETAETYKGKVFNAMFFELLDLFSSSGGMLSSWYFYFFFREVSKDQLPEAYRKVEASLKRFEERVEVLPLAGALASPLEVQPPQHFGWSEYFDFLFDSQSSLHTFFSFNFDILSFVNVCSLSFRYFEIREALKEAGVREEDLSKWTASFKNEVREYTLEMNALLDEATGAHVSAEDILSALDER